jgi:hypothetical protein
MLTRAVAASSIALLLLACGAAGVSLSAGPQDGGDDERQLLAGSIDIHVHSLPDDRARSIDAIDVARLAQARGMRAIVLKNHFDSTAPLAWVVARLVPGIQVLGGVVLNRPVGGVNPAAVEHMAQVTGGLGKVVWMPTFDSENGVRVSKENRPFVSVMRDGALLPEVKEVLDLVARHGLTLATGHSSPDETLAILREARARGIQRMVVTHAMFTPVLMNIEQMKQAASIGAYLEFAGGRPTGPGAAERLARFAEAIRAIGVDRIVLSTDLGQPNNPLPPDGFGEFLVALRQQGFSPAEIGRMAKDNPARLLGLAP